MVENKDEETVASVTKSYSCNICKKVHKVKLKKSLLDGKTSFPFTYVFLHGDLYDILTTLYLDAELNIRGVEAVKLDDSENIFDKTQMANMINTLTKEIARMQNEYNILLQKYNKLLEKSKN